MVGQETMRSRLLLPQNFKSSTDAYEMLWIAWRMIFEDVLGVFVDYLTVVRTGGGVAAAEPAKLQAGLIATRTDLP